MKDKESATALVDRLWSKVCNFKNRHGAFRKDHVLGILLSHMTCSQPSICELIMGKLEGIISTYGQSPSLRQVISAIESSTQEVTSQKMLVTPTNSRLLMFQQLHVAGKNRAVEMGDDEFL
ncbi:hypothetical protein O181_121865 [Austropuccinia psidii MF-1]|uniref:Uncharacterized protein n=1 Tax=Austropuccinia psidii MF-1 TaxID=1389203 RepID=A0A9Q3KIB4_9BASI|nr:hypothetical protein [Austropuccinia psidii MF-1]